MVALGKVTRSLVFPTQRTKICDGPHEPPQMLSFGDGPDRKGGSTALLFDLFNEHFFVTW